MRLSRSPSHSLEIVEGEVRHNAKRMRQATTGYVDSIHRAYTTEITSLPPAVRARLPLVACGPFEVAAVGLRNLHILATHDKLATCGDDALEVQGSEPPLSWTLRFYDVGVLPPLRTLDESKEPAVDDVRRVLGISGTLYHLVLQEDATLSAHWAQHVGAGLANSHAAAVTDFATMRRQAGGRGDFVDEMEVVATTGLRHCQRLLAMALAPGDAHVAELAAADHPLDPVQLRRAVLSALRPPVR
jgi:hypothetical protein